MPAARLPCSLGNIGADRVSISHHAGGRAANTAFESLWMYRHRRRIRAARVWAASGPRRISLSLMTGEIEEIKMEKTSSLGKAHTDAERIFRTLLPAHGLAIRQAQIEQIGRAHV